MSHTARPPAPPRTVRLRPDGRAADSGHHHPDTTNTDYELSASVTAPPAVRFVQDHPAGVATSSLSPAARDQFRRRLMLCCLIASAPFAFFVACTATNFIPLFGRATVGWTGLVLSAVTLAGLGTTAAFLYRRRDLAEDGLRVLEVSVFGVMAMFFAYWQFQVLTAVPHGNGQTSRSRPPSWRPPPSSTSTGWLLIVFHGVLVPNTLARGVGVAVAMCSVALAISLIAAVNHPPTGRHAGSLFTLAAVYLSAGAGLSVFGTAKTEALRREVESAREQVRQLGQYRLKKKLGHGGMGEVYLAEHQLLKRPCAIKRIHPRT